MQKHVVLHIAPVGEDRASGFYYSIPGLVGALHRQGVQTGLLTTHSGGKYPEPRPYPIVYYKEIGLARLFRDLPPPLNKPDILVFHDTYIPIHAIWAAVSHQKGIPYVITPRGGMTTLAQSMKRLKKQFGNLTFFNWMVNHAAALHCLTEAEAEDVRLWGRPVFIVGNGITLPETESVTWPGQNQSLRFVFIGRLDLFHKGLDLLINGCALVRRELKAAGALVQIFGPDHAGNRAEIERLINAKYVGEIVQVEGPIYSEQKKRLLQDTDVFIHTSRFEGHPMSVLEALSYGIPCLLTPGTNMAEEVVRASAGWKVEANAESIAKGLLSVLESRSTLGTKGRAARALAKHSYSWQSVAEKLLKEYEKLL